MCNTKLKLNNSLDEEIIVGIDVDNVIADFSKLFINNFQNLTNKSLCRNDLVKWNFKEAINDLYKGEIDGEVANHILSDEKFFSDLELKEGVLEALTKLSNNKNIKIIIVTAIENNMQSIRTKWLKDKLKDIDYSVAYEQKKDRVKMDYLIDDGIHNLDMLSSIISKDNCLCIAEPYNKSCEYNRFNTLNEAILYILKKEDLL
ncbi:hypothetical protein C4D27_17440 [Clostridium perfringens]